jgi:hypothetical protein
MKLKKASTGGGKTLIFSDSSQAYLVSRIPAVNRQTCLQPAWNSDKS